MSLIIERYISIILVLSEINSSVIDISFTIHLLEDLLYWHHA